jgi:putative Mg2+ transporter-C (MgtC) family protein
VAADLTWWEITGRLALAALLGALVGLERESAGQDAGFRTHLLLSLGAALFGAVSVAGFDDFVTDARTNVQVDVTRVASYVAAGVGFIGGGVILKHAGSVRGITTAASLWTAAAIGLAAGVGMWIGAVAATAVALVALAGLKPLSEWVGRRSHPPSSLVVVVASPAVGVEVLRTVESIAGTSLRAVQLGEGQEDGAELAVQFWHRPDMDVMTRIVDGLHEQFGPAVKSVSLRS